MADNNTGSSSANDSVSMLQINNDRKEMFINPNGGAKGFYICDESLQEKLCKLIDLDETKYIDVDGKYYEREVGWHVDKIIRETDKQIITATPTGNNCDFTYTLSEHTYTYTLQLDLDDDNNIEGSFDNITKYGDDKAVLKIVDPTVTGSSKYLYCILKKYTYVHKKTIIFDDDLDGWEGGGGGSTVGTADNPIAIPFYMKKGDMYYTIDIYDSVDEGTGFDLNRVTVARTSDIGTAKVFNAPFYVMKGTQKYAFDVYDTQDDGIGLNITKVTA